MGLHNSTVFLVSHERLSGSGHAYRACVDVLFCHGVARDSTRAVMDGFIAVGNSFCFYKSSLGRDGRSLFPEHKKSQA